MMASDSVRAVALVALGAASHAAWWLRYRMHGDTRPAQVEPRRRQRPPAGDGAASPE